MQHRPYSERMCSRLRDLNFGLVNKGFSFSFPFLPATLKLILTDIENIKMCTSTKRFSYFSI